MPIPMQFTAPSEQMGSNVLQGLTGDILKKVTKNIIDTTSQHATEAIQAGVPYGHILDQLIKMAPAGANLSGGGNQPPSGPNGNSGGPPPGGQPPTATKNQDKQITPQATTATADIQAPSQQGQADGNAILSQLLTAMQSQGGGQQFQMPSFLGIQPSAQNQVLLTEAAKNKQALAGQAPMQIGDLQKLIAGVGEKQLSAQVVPPTQYEKGQQAAAAYQAQLDNAQKQVQALNDEETRATANFNAMINARPAWSRLGEPKDKITEFKAQLNNIAERRDKANAELLDLYGKHPNLKKPDTVSSKELIGKTIGKYKIVSVK